jgi:transposase
VINVAILSLLRRMHFREGLALREIARRTGLSRNTVKKYIAGELVEPKYVRRQGSTNLDGFADKLAGWMKVEATKGRKQRRSVRQMHADLVALGYRGSYDRVAAFGRIWQNVQRELTQSAAKGTFVPLIFAAGEAFQFDWSEDHAVIAGEHTKIQVAHFRLCHSRAFTLRAYLLQTHEMLFDAHNHAFTVFGGVPRRGIYDNMKTAVDRVGKGKLRTVNSRFEALASHYLFEADFCNPASGWEKGQVEKQVQDARHRLWHTAPKFASLTALNEWLAAQCPLQWKQLPHPATPHRTIAEMFDEERSQLMPLPRLFDGFIEHTKRVTPTCLICFERNRYSVPASFANRPVSVRIYATKLVIVAEGGIICEHERLIRRGHSPGATIYDWRHYLGILKRKPGALRNGAPFVELPDEFKQLQRILMKRPGGDREMVEILALVVHHDEALVVKAVEQALALETPSKQHVLNVLARLIDPQLPRPVVPPAALQLAIEPEANVDRYDQLRGDQHAA